MSRFTTILTAAAFLVVTAITLAPSANAARTKAPDKHVLVHTENVETWKIDCHFNTETGQFAFCFMNSWFDMKRVPKAGTKWIQFGVGILSGGTIGLSYGGPDWNLVDAKKYEVHMKFRGSNKMCNYGYRPSFTSKGDDYLSWFGPLTAKANQDFLTGFAECDTMATTIGKAYPHALPLTGTHAALTRLMELGAKYRNSRDM